MAAVRELARTRAVVVISHRLANAVAAQRIYVLEHGRVVGEGTHEELLEGCGEYRQLWETQQVLERYSAASVPAQEDEGPRPSFEGAPARPGAASRERRPGEGGQVPADATEGEVSADDNQD